MITIFLELDNENVIGWGSSLDGPSVEIEKDHVFFKNPRSYKFVNGELVKGETPNVPVEKTEFEEMKEQMELMREAIDFLLMNGGL